MIICLDQPTNDNFGSSLGCILRSLGQLATKNQDDDEIEFKLDRINFVHPLFILPIVALYNSILDANRSVKFTTSRCQDYLGRIHFPNGFNPLEIEKWQEELKSYENKSYLPICKIPCSQQSDREAVRDQLISNINTILERGLQIPRILMTAISYLVSELIDNIINHAQVDYGWIMYQNYPYKGYLDICIIDSGIGLLKSYLNNDVPGITTHREALEKALNGLSTKQYEGNRGYGIVTSRMMLANGLGGTFFMYSGDAAYVKSPSTEAILQFKSIESWDGTIIALRIPEDVNEKFSIYDYIS